jgi:hypothetical protein
MLPFSAAADRNKDVVLETLRPILANRTKVLEIGSGNGQHAVHVTNALPHITWQCSDLPDNVPGIAERLKQDGNDRTPAPIALDVASPPWPSASTGRTGGLRCHLLQPTHCTSCHLSMWKQFFARAGEVLSTQDGALCVYGPLKYGGAFTTDSNAAFDVQLKSWNPVSGIRDFEDLDALAQRQPV